MKISKVLSGDYWLRSLICQHIAGQGGTASMDVGGVTLTYQGEKILVESKFFRRIIEKGVELCKLILKR